MGMAFHTYPLERADALEDPSRYRYCSREELVDAVDPDRTDVVADLGSGTGFYTDDVAPFVARCYAVDVQSGMHDRYREKGLPENVRPVTAAVDAMPFDDGDLDAAFTTMTYHEFATAEALAEIRRVLDADGRLVVVDGSARGDGEEGPSPDERYDLARARGQLREAGFAERRSHTRPETFLLVAKPRT
jgi:ubiquinone/menaquinone biosynthesis C-methylase UbiE